MAMLYIASMWYPRPQLTEGWQIASILVLTSQLDRVVFDSTMLALLRYLHLLLLFVFSSAAWIGMNQSILQSTLPLCFESSPERMFSPLPSEYFDFELRSDYLDGTPISGTEARIERFVYRCNAEETSQDLHEVGLLGQISVLGETFGDWELILPRSIQFSCQYEAVTSIDIESYFGAPVYIPDTNYYGAFRIFWWSRSGFTTSCHHVIPVSFKGPTDGVPTYVPSSAVDSWTSSTIAAPLYAFDLNLHPSLEVTLTIVFGVFGGIFCFLFFVVMVVVTISLYRKRQA